VKNLRIVSVAGLGALALTLGLGYLATVRAQPMPAPKPTVVGVVDITKIVKDLKEVQTITNDLQMQRAALGIEDKKRSDALIQLNTDLEMYVNPVEREKEISKLKKQAIELEVWRKVAQSDYEAEFAHQHEKLYRKIVATIGQVAKETGVDMVLMKEPEINLAGATAQQIFSQITIRKLLWAGDNVPDLTQRVVARMDIDFNSPAPGATTKPAGTATTPGH
jgi:Skp family chaperone for outer membrane proteins